MTQDKCTLTGVTRLGHAGKEAGGAEGQGLTALKEKVNVYANECVKRNTFCNKQMGRKHTVI